LRPNSFAPLDAAEEDRRAAAQRFRADYAAPTLHFTSKRTRGDHGYGAMAERMVDRGAR
jgi:hypothetical protein